MTDKNGPNWNKLTLNAERKRILKRSFEDMFEPRVNDVRNKWIALSDKVYREWVANQPMAVRSEVERMAREPDAHKNTYLRRCDEVTLRIDVRKSRAARFKGKKVITCRWYSHFDHATRKQVRLDKWGMPIAGVMIKLAHPLAKEVLAMDVELEAVKEEQRSALANFGLILNSVRNCGALLKVFPSAIEFFPGDWVVMASPKARDVVPVVFANKLEAVIKAEKAWAKVAKS